MDTLFDDVMYFHCAVCGGHDDYLEVSMEEPRWRTNDQHQGLAAEYLCNKVDFSISVTWKGYSLKQKIRQIWRIIRGKSTSDNVVSLDPSQISILAWRLKHWAMYGDPSRTPDKLPKGVGGETFVASVSDIMGSEPDTTVKPPKFPLVTEGGSPPKEEPKDATTEPQRE